MNIYRHQFTVACPRNQQPVSYFLEIQTPAMIFVEDIQAKAGSYRSEYHERLADDLYQTFGGAQRLIAKHGAVEVETRR